jgi:uncharacterized protein
MSQRPVDPHALNVRAFCGEGQALAGDWPLSAMRRLGDGLFEPAGPEATLAWSAQGSLVPLAAGEPEFWLHLRASASVPLQCQRCLQPVQQDLAVDRRFRFVRTEEEAERLDEVSEDDVLVLGPRLDLQELLEDELILALPIVPRHEGRCPVPLPLPVDDLEEEAPAPNPFAALAALRAGRGGVK